MTNSPSITATDYGHLKVLIQTEIANYGPNCDLNHIDVSNITSMMGLFQDSEFNGSIADWNVSKVTNMESIFNGDISRWNVERLRYASGMFEDSKFNGDVRSWRPVALMEAHGMFAQSMFRGDLSQWPLPPACDTKYMLSPEMLSEMTAPCLYHWRLLLEGKMPMDLPSTWMTLCLELPELDAGL